ncbi:25S rRNA (uracil2634-N3)-methyltransferase [Blastomyces dermatitidis ER-3]|uniref:25S rRNA (uridine-N(3))-methyltransferase BMT5-like domain-containing protein n=1 Tax=Ajellomyces dermatitidis (strain ER-3 / ATCC MYA-2586) TaxID=559297 RepID=A0ABP2F0M5_AJEDR|nr:25S rRNA (uracil2634-N3)-methyltransferase [Blastomyces dermatitidis ER-3]EEQ90194.1 hypothetical protein BDCG_05314 [Blastomyces dermatitidis ER-3]EQL29112.1 hypothetical protein BDFG_08238 [Blastomyces dermatitidis ATCC 26199]
MGKSKKPRITNFHHLDRHKSRSSTAAVNSRAGGAGPGGPKKMKSFSRVSTSAPAFKDAQGSGSAKEKPNSKNANANANANAQSRPPTIPFQKRDRILLVGEGDFSFALSLAVHYGCKNLLATSYDAEQALYEKYPQAKLHIEKLCSRGSETSSSPSKILKRKREQIEGFESDDRNNEEREERDAKDENLNPKTQDIEKRPETQDAKNQVPKVLFSIDARKLGSGPAGGGQAIRNGFPRATAPLPAGKNKNHRPWKDAINSPQHQNHQQHTGRGGPWDIICFNFPHVGGLSTDVNRQVRANQELLVSFFKACIPLLSEPVVLPTTSQDGDDGDGDECDDDDDDWPDSHSEPSTGSDIEKEEKQHPRTTPGQILVSLFEGEPYTLWNIRDLARHAGLRVVTSFRFPWASYPGYSHARTIGEIEKRNGGPGRGGWRGEDREARMYVFEKRGAEGVGGAGAAGGKKRKKGGKGRGGENSDDDSD